MVLKILTTLAAMLYTGGYSVKPLLLSRLDPFFFRNCTCPARRAPVSQFSPTDRPIERPCGVGGPLFSPVDDSMKEMKKVKGKCELSRRQRLAYL